MKRSNKLLLGFVLGVLAIVALAASLPKFNGDGSGIVNLDPSHLVQGSSTFNISDANHAAITTGVGSIQLADGSVPDLFTMSGGVITLQDSASYNRLTMNSTAQTITVASGGQIFLSSTNVVATNIVSTNFVGGYLNFQGAISNSWPMTPNPVWPIAPTPMLAYNNFYDDNGKSTLYATSLLTVAQSMQTNGMLAAGWRYIWMDDGWPLTNRDSNLNLVPDPSRFPNGMPDFVQKIHNLGMKVGIYIARNSDSNSVTCFGLPGSTGANFQRDLNQFASWGIDAVKFDTCNLDAYTLASAQRNQLYYRETPSVMVKSGRNMAIWWSVEFGLNATGPVPSEVANEMNTISIAGTVDAFINAYPIALIWTNAIFAYTNSTSPTLYQVYGPGHFPYVGSVEPGGWTANTFLNFMSMLAVLPASAATANVAATPSVLQYYTNAAVFAAQQDPGGLPGYPVFRDANTEVWVRPMGYTNSLTNLVALVNRDTGSSHNVTLNWSYMSGVSNATAMVVQDLWSGVTYPPFTTSFTTNLPASSVALVELVPNAAVVAAGSLPYVNIKSPPAKTFPPAVGDGVTDDTAALQGFLNYWAYTNSSPVRYYIPLGHYRFTVPLSIPTNFVNGPPNSGEGGRELMIEGDGKIASILEASNLFNANGLQYLLNGNLTNGNQMFKIQFKNFGVWGPNSTNIANHANGLPTSLNTSVLGAGLFLGFNANLPYLNTASVISRVDNCSFEGWRDGIVITNTVTTKVSDTMLFWNWHTAVMAAHADGLTLDNCETAQNYASSTTNSLAGVYLPQDTSGLSGRGVTLKNCEFGDWDIGVYSLGTPVVVQAGNFERVGQACRVDDSAVTTWTGVHFLNNLQTHPGYFRFDTANSCTACSIINCDGLGYIGASNILATITTNVFELYGSFTSPSWIGYNGAVTPNNMQWVAAGVTNRMTVWPIPSGGGPSTSSGIVTYQQSATMGMGIGADIENPGTAHGKMTLTSGTEKWGSIWGSSGGGSSMDTALLAYDGFPGTFVLGLGMPHPYGGAGSKPDAIRFYTSGNGNGSGSAFLDSTGNFNVNGGNVNLEGTGTVIGGGLPVLTKTANFALSLTYLDSGSLINNSGAGGAVTNTLPATYVGKHYGLYVDAAQNLAFKAINNDIIKQTSTNSASGGLVFSSTVGNCLHLYCPVTNKWVVDTTMGTWTLQ